MSENAGTDYLQRRVAELERKHVQLKAALKSERETTRAIREKLGVQSIGEATAKLAEILEDQDDYETVLGENDRLKGLLGTPDEKDQRIADLTSKLTARDHRDAFASVKLAQGASVEDLWNKLGYQAEGDAPTAEKVAELLGTAREKAPFLFAPDEAESSNSQAVTPPSGPGGSRGARDTTSERFRVRREDAQDPLWMQANQSKLAEAVAAGNVLWTD